MLVVLKFDKRPHGILSKIGENSYYTFDAYACIHVLVLCGKFELILIKIGF